MHDSLAFSLRRLRWCGRSDWCLPMPRVPQPPSPSFAGLRKAAPSHIHRTPPGSVRQLPKPTQLRRAKTIGGTSVFSSEYSYYDNHHDTFPPPSRVVPVPGLRGGHLATGVVSLPGKFVHHLRIHRDLLPNAVLEQPMPRQGNCVLKVELSKSVDATWPPSNHDSTT